MTFDDTLVSVCLAPAAVLTSLYVYSLMVPFLSRHAGGCQVKVTDLEDVKVLLIATGIPGTEGRRYKRKFLSIYKGAVSMQSVQW